MGKRSGLRTGGLGYGSDAIRQKFTAYERDSETGLDYAQARYCLSSQGRFTSPDPLMASAKATDPQSWNRYGYVVNNPLKYIDPSGMIMGKRKDGDFGSISVYEGNIGTWMGSGPQRQETAVVDLVVDQPMGAPGVGTQSEPALSAEDATKAVRSVVLPMVKNNKQCRKFLDGMLSELDRTTHVAPIKRNFLSVFNNLSKKVGFVDLSGLVDDYGETTLIGGNLSVGINFSLMRPTGPFSLEITAVHEVFHAAASQNLYGEYDMAKAAYDIGTRMRIIPRLVEPPKRADTQDARAYNSRLINQVIFNTCKLRLPE